MLTNADMKAGRFGAWAAHRRMLREITSHLDAGRTVLVSTMTRATRFQKKHAGMFKATRNGLYAQAGRSWNCLASGGQPLVRIDLE